MKHDLKIWPEYFREVVNGKKTFEIRKNDRGFKVGDEIVLREYNNLYDRYTGKKVTAKITFMTDFNPKKDGVFIALIGLYVVFSFKLIKGAPK